MRSIFVSIEVFAKLWSLREEGEDSEDAILCRILECKQKKLMTNVNSPAGVFDVRFDVHFPEGFVIFRTFKGTRYSARAVAGHWVLENDGRRYQTLSQLSRAIGAGIENAWMNWFYIDENGKRQPVSNRRLSDKITRRKAGSVLLSDF